MNGRIIRYLEIKNCTLTEQNGKPALLAPEDAETERLKDNGFLQMPDGKWVHFLTKSEQQVIGEAGQEQTEIVFIGLKNADVSAKTSRILTVISAALLPLGILTLCLGGVTAGWMLLALLMLTGALILSIAAVSYDRDNGVAKAMLFFSIAFLICALLLLFFVTAIRSACDSCEEQCHHIPG